MDFSKSKSFIIVLEGYGIFVLSYVMSGYYLSPTLVGVFYHIPPLTISIILSSVVSPLISIIYIAWRVRYIPDFSLSKKFFLYLLSGLIMAWVVNSLKILFLGQEVYLEKEIFETPYPYNYFNLLSIIFLGSFFEEVLYRGYFFKILEQRLGVRIAFLFSSFLFVFDHGVWWAFDYNLLFTLCYSVIFTVVYLQAGLVASTLVHVFVNLYMFLPQYLSMSAS